MKTSTKLFIGSSVEGLRIAESVKAQLEHSDIRAEIWTQGTFKANGYPLEQLECALDKYQHGLFVMTPDDMVFSRDAKYAAARDNVLLELGMFIGRYGRNNCFILVPRGENTPKMPSDLSGFNTVSYNSEWADESIDAALGSPVREIRQSIEEITERKKGNSLGLKRNSEDSNEIDSSQSEILKLLFSVPDGTKSNIIVDYMDLDKSLCLYHIDQLTKYDYVDNVNETIVITQKGRKQVVEVIGL
ncbi:nucleotide-binding protein [Vibrio nigripulchritudo]|uniref:nucleotide-binding protein n=1 Tax=Vibrio nigripulchritudo TaxID=28173 RepID=UPI00138DF571|nr:nucleotide-binding protein [Vibrio nigripulchritudo]